MGSPSTAYEVEVATQQANSSCKFFLLNDSTNIRNMSIKGGTNGAVVMSLDPSGSIANASLYSELCQCSHNSDCNWYVN